MRTSRRSTGGRGAALIEFALILPLLLTILLGTITGGLSLAKKNSAANAVREAARLGATLPEGAGWNTWALAVQGRAVEIAGGDLTTADVCVAMVSVTGVETTIGSALGADCDPSPGPPATPATTASGTCVVKVWARTDGSINVGLASQSLTLDAQAVGTYERDACP